MSLSVGVNPQYQSKNKNKEKPKAQKALHVHRPRCRKPQSESWKKESVNQLHPRTKQAWYTLRQSPVRSGKDTARSPYPGPVCLGTET